MNAEPNIFTALRLSAKKCSIQSYTNVFNYVCMLFKMEYSDTFIHSDM